MFPNMFSTPGYLPAPSRILRWSVGCYGPYADLSWSAATWSMLVKRAFPKADADVAIESQVRLEFLYRNERSALVRFFTRHRASPAEADDLTQEAFLRLARVDDPSVPILQPAAYLRQIARNLLRNEAKSGHRLSQAIDPAAFEQVASNVDEVARLEARDSLRRIEAVLTKLKPKTRAIFLAHRIDGMTYGQIAEKTGMSVKGVEKQMGKAIAAIGKALEHHK